MFTTATLKRVVLSVLSVAAICATPVVGSAQVFAVEPMMMSYGSPDTYGVYETCITPALWPTGWMRSSIFGTGIGHLSGMSADQLRQCVSTIRNAGKELAVQVGPLKPECGSAQQCWSRDVDALRTIDGGDGAINYLELDEPLTYGWTPIDYSYAVEQTAQWILLARTEFPLVKIILIEAFPYQASRITSFFSDVNRRTIELTGTGIQYAVVDHNWDPNNMRLAEIRDIQNAVRSQGMQFGVIYWASEVSGMPWYDGLMEQGRIYRAWERYGLQPDLYSIMNWSDHTMLMLPEQDRFERSFTNSVRDFANTWVQTPTSEFGLRSNEVLLPNDARTSVDGRFRLQYQGDGNLVLYAGNYVLWASNTNGHSAGQTVMQGDGNLVVYDANWRAVWSSGTNGHPGSYLVVQSDGNLVVYTGHWAAWASNTAWY